MNNPGNCTDCPFQLYPGRISAFLQGTAIFHNRPLRVCRSEAYSSTHPDTYSFRVMKSKFIPPQRGHAAERILPPPPLGRDSKACRHLNANIADRTSRSFS